MDDTATPVTGPVDAPASIESIAAEIAAGGGSEPEDNLEEVTQELVNEAEGQGDSEEEPEAEDDATDPADEEANDPEEGTPQEPLHTVKVNGEERQVPLSELLNGYSRTEDYKAKTAAVAEERRALEAERQTVEAREAAKYANQLEEATNLFAQFDPVLSEARNINWDALKQQDPAAYVQAQDALNERVAAIQRMNAHVQQIREQTQHQQQAELQREREQRFDKAAEEIVKQRPELADEAKFKAFAGEAVESLKELGFTGEEIVDALDHRVLMLVDLAREGKAARAARQALPDRKVVARSAVKPLTTDGTGSLAPKKPRFPARASRDAKGNWIAEQILSASE